MWTVLVVLVLIHIATSSAQGDSSFYVDEGPSDGSGDPACHLATPRIIKWREESEDAFYYVNLTYIPTVNQRIEHRVGYVKTVAVFDYVGCIQINETSGIQPNITNLSPDIGTCYSYCNTEYFGISMSWCYCFTSTPLLDYKWCSTLCGDGEKVCGGPNNLTSIFKIASSDDTLDDINHADGKNCRLFDVTANAVLWENCSKKAQGLCSDLDDGVKWTLNQASMDWHTYTNKCFQHRQYPVTDVSDKAETVNYWLGRFKTEIIERMYGRHQDDPTHIEFGYVYYDSNGFRLIFQKIKEEKGLRLCVNESTFSTSTTEQSTTTPTTSAATTTASLASSSFTDTSGFTTQSTDKATKSSQRGKPKSTRFIGSLYFYIIVGGSALVFVLLLVIVCCCCIRRKRRKGNAHIESKQSAEKQDQTPAGGDVTYDVCDTPATSGSSGAPRDTDYDTAATLATHSSRSPARGDDADTSNVYNTTQDFSNDIYDHAGASKDKPAVFGDNIYNTMATEDLYDHTSSDKSKPTFVGGNIYSTSRTVREGQDNQAEDTYDNAGGVATQSGAGVVSKAGGIYDTAEGTSGDGGGP